VRDESTRLIAALQERYAGETKLPLKIKHNNILGFFLELNPKHAEKLDNAKFIHRQTLASAVRYTTDELMQLDQQILQAKEKTLAVELELFATLVQRIKEAAYGLHELAEAVAALDAYSALAELAERENYTRPHVEES